MKKIALLTTHISVSVGDHDDHLLIKELKDNGYEAKEVSWHLEHNWQEFDLVIVRTPWDYSAHKDQFVEVLTKIDQATTLLNPLKIMLWNMEKTYLKELQDKGINTIPTIWLKNSQALDYQELSKKLGTKKIIIKPSVGAGSEGLIKAESPYDLKNLPDALTRSPYYMAQPFIEGVLKGEESYFFFNGKFSHAIKKIPRHGDFRVQPVFGSEVIPLEITPEKHQNCLKILNSLETLPFYARLDFLSDENDFYLIELEMIEPHLYLSWDENAAKNLVNEIAKVLTA